MVYDLGRSYNLFIIYWRAYVAAGIVHDKLTFSEEIVQRSVQTSIERTYLIVGVGNQAREVNNAFLPPAGV